MPYNRSGQNISIVFVQCLDSLLLFQENATDPTSLASSATCSCFSALQVVACGPPWYANLANLRRKELPQHPRNSTKATELDLLHVKAQQNCKTSVVSMLDLVPRQAQTRLQIAHHRAFRLGFPAPLAQPAPELARHRSEDLKAAFTWFVGQQEKPYRNPPRQTVKNTIAIEIPEIETSGIGR